jgi:archaellum component FlaD/FlaE
MLKWYDFCDGEGCSNDLDIKILDYFNKIGIIQSYESPYQTDEK